MNYDEPHQYSKYRSYERRSHLGNSTDYSEYNNRNFLTTYKHNFVVLNFFKKDSS